MKRERVKDKVSTSSEGNSDAEKKPRKKTGLKEVKSIFSRSSQRHSCALDPRDIDKNSMSEEKIPHKDQSLSKRMKSVTRKKKIDLTRNASKKLRSSGFKSLKPFEWLGSYGNDRHEDIKVNEMQPLITNNVEQESNNEKGVADKRVNKTAPELDKDEEAWIQDEECKRSPVTRTRCAIVEKSDDEWHENVCDDENMSAEDEIDEVIGIADVAQARFVLRSITSRVPLIEETAIRRGVKLSGPPLEFATTHLDEYARKFRWPQHVRNLRTTKFSQDPSEILEDYEVLTELRQTEPYQSDHDMPKQSPFAQVPRPLVALAAKALQCLSRKRKHASYSEYRQEPAVSAAALLTIARAGSKFSDYFVESLLTANGKAMQGIEDYDLVFDNRCWSSLPTKKTPIANWRFVFEHVRKTVGNSGSDNALYSPLRPMTLQRITKRLKKLYGYTTQHEEYDIFADAPA